MIACRLFEYYPFSPSSPPFLLFLWLSAVRVHTHPWAKESKIDHTGNWSRCTGTGSSSGADLSHAGKIMHPELTTQRTRLPGTSFGKRCHNFTKGPKPGEENHRDPPLVHRKRLSETLRLVRSFGTRRASLASATAAHSLCHEDCWQWRNLCGGKGRQRGHSRSQSRSEHNQILSGRLSISFLLHNTADTLYQSPSAFSSRPSAGTAPSGEGLGVRGLHSTSIWQVSMNTSLLHEAAWIPSLALFGEHARACTAAWFIGDGIFSVGMLKLLI